MEQYKKLLCALRFTLLGKGYIKALKALHFGQRYHTGVRKDKVTPEFQHQVEIALYILTLPDVQDLEDVLASVFLHDVQEDYGIESSTIEELFGKRVAEIVWLLTKEFMGQETKSRQQYFEDIGEDRAASVIKGADRIHNVQSMVGVFSLEKQRKYMIEVEDDFLPTLKFARRNFPEQTMAYYNMEHMLKSQIELIQAIHEAGNQAA